MEQPKNIPTGKREYTLIEQYTCPLTGICVPKGLKYDGASIPRVCWSLIGLSPDGLLRAAALVHDWCYINGGIVEDSQGAELTLSKKEADKLFYELLMLAGVNPYRAKVAHFAVRCFGRGGYKGD